MSLKEPVISSRVEEETATALMLLDLPPELVLRITSLLEVRDLLALRIVRFKLDKPEPPQPYRAKTELQVHTYHYPGQASLESDTS